jgi:hypothetical protein
MHTYDAITATGLLIHLSMTDDAVCYILVHNLQSNTTVIKFFTNIEPALDFIHSL